MKSHIAKGVVAIPFDLFEEMLRAHRKMGQILETLDTLADEKGLKAIRNSRAQVAKGEFVECSADELEKVLKKKIPCAANFSKLNSLHNLLISG